MRALSLLPLFALVVACTPEAKAPAAQVSAPVAQEAAAAPVTGEESAFDQSNGKVQFVGAKVTGSHLGEFKEFAGTFNLVDGDPAKSSVEVTIQTASVVTDSAKLDDHLRSADFFDVENIPTSTFKSTSIVKADEGFTVNGNLTLHGVTKGITFPAKISVEADKVGVEASFGINRKEFDIVYPGMPDDLIRDAVDMTLSLSIPRAGAAPAPQAEAQAE